MFRWIPEAAQEQKQRVTAELSRLPALLPVLRAYHMGADLGVDQGNFDWAAVADFDDREGYLTFRDNPEHRAIIAAHIRPIIAERAAIQYEF